MHLNIWKPGTYILFISFISPPFVHHFTIFNSSFLFLGFLSSSGFACCFFILFFVFTFLSEWVKGMSVLHYFSFCFWLYFILLMFNFFFMGFGHKFCFSSQPFVIYLHFYFHHHTNFVSLSLFQISHHHHNFVPYSLFPSPL
jgi:hypothetical protein